MKILKLRFQNLNSLLGEWEIDFSTPPFAAEGIFAITGPTGAGKSTILDALCLALYGQTPRLGRITKSTNEIMSRQAGDCLAEVTFATRDGVFRCCWSQHRARHKPGGELQNPQHEIVADDKETVLENKLRAVVDKVEEITGLDFERFTRSMLLAQGSFALFLKARPDERAPILEQITGTGIYSRISIAVHEKRGEERGKLQLLEAGLNDLRPLEEELELELKQRLEEKSNRTEELNRQLQKTDRALAWLEQLAALEKEGARLARERQEWENQNREFTPERGKLERAERARKLEAGFAEVRLRRQEHEEEQKTLESDREKVPRRRAALEKTASDLGAATARFEENRAALIRLEPSLRRVRELDLTLREKEKPLKELTETIADRQRELERQAAVLEETKHRLKDGQAALSGLNEALRSSAADSDLVNQLGGIENRGANLKELEDDRQKLAAAAAKAVADEKTADLSYRQCEQESEQAQKSLAETRKLREQKARQLQQLLGEKSLPDWRQELNLLQERQAGLEKAIEIQKKISSDTRELAELKARENLLTAESEKLAAELTQQQKELEALKREQILTEENLLLKRRIESFSEARRELVAGRPCPLCGALEHPFTSDLEQQTRTPDRTAAALEKLRRQLAAAHEKSTRLAARQAAIDQEKQQAAERLEELARQRESDRARYCRLAAELDLPPTAEPRQLAELREEIGHRYEQAARLVQQAETLERESEQLRLALDEGRDEIEELEKKRLAAAFTRDAARRESERLKNEAAAKTERAAALWTELGREIAPFDLDQPSLATLDKILEELRRRRQEWLLRNEEKNRLERELSTLESKVENLVGIASGGRKELEELRRRADAGQREIEKLAGQRRELFGDRDPEREEKRLQQAAAEAEQAREEARRKLDREKLELENLNGRIREATRKEAESRARLAKVEEIFRKALQAAGFSDENDYRDALLPEERHRALADTAAALERRATELATRKRELEKRLKQEQARRLTDRPREELVRLRDDTAQKLAWLQQEIGGLHRQLTENEELKSKRSARLEALAAQTRECQRWDLLHELIGSSDGKKFRNFAQSLTFRIMIGQANRQLKEMTDRYLLTQSATHPLELDVIDGWQGGEIRSTRNLSGGESFIVSLALALGLSRMAGRKVSIDSLFLDEGFGTLDDEALDAALEALAGLQQDGKLIGIISHVSALRERIATKIEVVPMAGGRSRIEGPGCRRIIGG